MLAGYWLLVIPGGQGIFFLKKPFVKPGGHGHWKFFKQPIPGEHMH